MGGDEEVFRSMNPPRPIKGSRSQPTEMKELLISPGFRTAVELAGWDEESLLAGLIVEDTPERSISKRKKRRIFLSKTPPTDSKR
ncbi:hypothetical protein ZOSMA_56G00280 [Zostera marina]|uniref:Uncharacterized protein n=1 Tax=Zostera marina TaxID=29655 RepID=A0A0K9NXM4_ZOSMR|nr:hypothetical protein ZOSMA_56G00280 [Zostera marina]